MASNLMQIISSIYLLPLLFTCTTYSLSHHEECLALFQFKQTILHQDYASSDADRFQKLDSWMNITSNASDYGSDCCLWGGVVCNNEGHVIELDLSQSSLSGPIKSNSTLFDLVHLQSLNLSMNNFVGSQIPGEISCLMELRILDLSNSGFGGQIPSAISQLVHLSSLDLSMNPLKLQSPSLRYLLQNLTGLEELHLSGVDIGSSIPLFLANFSSLRSIKFDDCYLQDEFPSPIFHLPKLKYLILGNNPDLLGSLPEFHNTTLLETLALHSTCFAGIIPESIGKLNHLEHLVLYNCSFSGGIPGSLSNLTQLTHLYLQQNNFTGPVPSLESLSKLSNLYLGRNNFEKGRFLHWIGQLGVLEELYVSHMNIYDEIPPSMANCTKLSFLAMHGNSIFGGIPSWFMNLTTLTVADLGDNQLRGPISSGFSTFKSLNYLNLGDNNFGGRVDLDMFLALNELEVLYLGYNNLSCVFANNYTDGNLTELNTLVLSSCNLKEFPPFLRLHKKLNELDLFDNKIEGLIPEWVWKNNQETLQSIFLSNNFITGFHQHSQVFPWVRLEVFEMRNNNLQGRLPLPPPTTIIYDVSYNYLEGEIPSLICEVKSLQCLDLSSNNMTGTLPPCLGTLSSSLLVLNLKRNNFQGPMIHTCIHGSFLQWVDLSENQFTGQLPKSFANCKNLQVLSVGDNSFEGIFPYWLGSLAQLQVLILRSNKFYGSIHGFTRISSQFLKLRIIDLSNNNFSGQLPAIDLSRNNFEGEIPESLQDLQGLQSLNLSNNHLTGRIFPSLGNLTNLESLDLSQNELSGEIPQQLLQLGFLAIFNVSFNHLEGRIPQGKQFDTFDDNSYKGNPRLCGQPLSKDCQSSKASTFPSTSNEYESLLPSERTDWIIIFMGVGNGLVIGIVFGNILFAKCSF